MDNKKFGEQGEKLAVKYLKRKGYKIVATNYTTRVGEIDIVAFDKKTLVFVEVKSRNNTKYGLPREAVTYYKQQHIIGASQLFCLDMKVHDAAIRFDVVEVLNDEINHIINAFTA